MTSQAKPPSCAPVNYPVDLYALTHVGNPGDLAFYRSACQKAESILELGSGYGRIAIGLAEAGLKVTGLELDEAFLARARAEALAHELSEPAQFIQGNMVDFELGRKFSHIIIPHSGLYCLLTAEEQLACLKRAEAHLAPGGLLLLDGYAADDFHESSEPEDLADDELEAVAQIEAAGMRYSVYEKSRWDKPAQRLHASYLYVKEPEGETSEFELPQRYLLRAELEQLLSAAGFGSVLVRGGFEGEPYDDDAEHLVVAAER